MLRLIRAITAAAAVLLCAGGYAASQWFALFASPPELAAYVERVSAPPIVMLSAVLLAAVAVLALIPRRDP